MPPELRMGCLRALATMGPLDLQGAYAVAWVAMRDADLEVRREACRTIRRLHDDRAVEYLLRFVVSEDRGAQFVAAQALREVNDDRAFAALASAIPAPQITAAMPNDRATSVDKVELPVGPYGARMPIYLPTQEVVGQATVSSPAADALRVIAGKDLGTYGFAWVGWLREKCGLYTARDRSWETNPRSVRDRMGDPQPTK
jgi:hypothetical protein